MYTRFDNDRIWIDGYGRSIEIESMETSHLLNVIKMLLQRPSRIVSMLVTDIEHNSVKCSAWCANMEQCEDVRIASLRNATSLGAVELLDWVKQTTLFQSMAAELDARGVNTANVIELFEATEVAE